MSASRKWKSPHGLDVTLIPVMANISPAALMMALRNATIDRDDFDHNGWSIADAESLEAAARLIRRGYQDDHKPA
jgi:hypothetical protein